MSYLNYIHLSNMEAFTHGLSLEHIKDTKDFDFPSHSCINRIMRDLGAIYEAPPPGILVIQDEEKVNVLYALITGPVQSPYEGGFFYFVIKCPNDYPIKPPEVKFMTTDAGKIRFNPNLYKCGKVCLSILGTWLGPPWSPAQTLSSTLISIQSLLCEDPYRNEPGYEKEKVPGDFERYNNIIVHETLRVAVCGMLENETKMVIPLKMCNYMKKKFIQYYDKYVKACNKYIYLQGLQMEDPFGEPRGYFNFKAILERLSKLHKVVSEQLKVEEYSSDDELIITDFEETD